MMWTLVGCLLCADICMAAVVWSLVRTCDRLMKTLSDNYRNIAEDETAHNADRTKHFSMYDRKDGNNA